MSKKKADDSSTLCVVPVFDKICETDNNQKKFMLLLNKMLKENHRGVCIQLSPWQKICYGKKTSAHEGELHQSASVSRLVWLVLHLCGAKRLITKLKSTKDKKTRENRKALFDGNPQIRDMAIQAIADNRPQKWMIFEGATVPDVCIITEKFVLVVEGKQTEGGRTTTTQWGEKRDQLIRHMDAFLDDGRPVYGLFICEEKDCDRYRSEYSMENVFKASLSHRSQDLIEKVKNGFIGVISWQTLGKEFGVKIGHKEK